MTNLEFVEAAKMYLGWGYAYGEKLGRKLTNEIINALVADNGREYYYFGNLTVEKWLNIKCIDCSGLVCYILNNGKLMTVTDQLNTDAHKLFWSYCKQVTKAELKVGDLVFRKSGRSIPHVGIYVGNGLTIEAKSTSKGVCYGSVQDFNLFGRLKLLKYDDEKVEIPVPQKPITPTPVEPVKKHWGEAYYDKLINAGMKLDKPDYDKVCTKAEMYAFCSKLYDLIKGVK